MPTTTEHAPVIVAEEGRIALYHLAFSQVSDPKDWKGPIKAYVPWELATLYMDAIEFMTGVRPTAEVRRIPDGRQFYYLECVGYRAGPCGDH